MSRAAKRETGFPPPPICVSHANGFAFSNAVLPETRVRVPGFEKQASIGASTWLTSTSRWGCGYRYDGTAAGRLVGLDYADQRFYASTYGRFNTADQYKASGGPNDPGSWNRYSYVQGDPINNTDPGGMSRCPVAIDTFDSSGNGDVSMGCGGSLTPIGYFYGCGPFIFEFQGPSPLCVAANSGALLVPETQVQAPSCDDTETAYLTTYLNQRHSPLAAYASEFVEFSDIQGLDDRFIVALAGVESTYGKGQNPAGSGQYNAFSNGAHCAALGVNAYCRTVNPYTDFGQAIAGAIDLIGSGAAYQPYSSTQNIYSIYERGDINVISGNQGLLDQIYGAQMKGDVSNVRKPRCP